MSDLSPRERELPPELPPVEPPSAGLIVQLFLIPGLIVLALVVAWWGVNKLAQPSQDWQTLVRDLQSGDEQVRWQGAFGLAQMLQADDGTARPGEPALVENKVVAQQLADMLDAQLAAGAPDDDDLKHQAFLARTLGLFHLPDVVLPTLRKAAKGPADREVRKNALGAVAVLANRGVEKYEPLTESSLVEDVEAISRDEDPLLRQLAAFTLGLLPLEASRNRLEVMLADGDEDTRLNAAIGLARQHVPAGWPVFRLVLQSAAQPAARGSAEEYQQFMKLKNTLAAVLKLAPDLAAADRAEARDLVAPIAKSYHEPRIQLDAQTTLRALNK